MKKKKESSMRKEVSANGEPPIWTEYYNFVTHQLAPASGQTKKRFGIEMVLYVKENKGCIRTQEFLEHVGISYATWKRWCQDDQEVADYNNAAKMILANRREKGGLNREYDAALVTKSMAMYDPEWRDIEEWRAKLNDGQDQGGTKIVIMEKYQEKE